MLSAKIYIYILKILFLLDIYIYNISNVNLLSFHWLDVFFAMNFLRHGALVMPTVDGWKKFGKLTS